MTRRLLTRTAAAAVLALALAACGDATDGPITDPPSTIALGDGGGVSDDGGAEDAEEEPDAASDIPAPDPADFAGMDENTPEGAEQAFRYYVALIFWGQQTGESSLLTAMQSESCKTCIQVAEDIESYTQRGEFWSRAEIIDIDVSAESHDDFDMIVGYTFRVSSHTVPGEQAGEIEHEGELLYSAAGGLDWMDDKWIIDDLSILNENSATE
ncbi:DUF6318 family protein [Brachybacterium sp. DNPG3]